MTTYRKPLPYRKPQSYRGAELVPGAGPPSVQTLFRGPWIRPAAQAGALRVPMPALPAHGHATALAWGGSIAQGAVARLPLRMNASHDAWSRLRWAWTDGRDPAKQFESRMPWSAPAPAEVRLSAPWADCSEQLNADARVPWRAASTHQAALRAAWGQLRACGALRSALWRALAGRGAYVALPWGPSAARQHGTNTPWPVEPNPGEPGSDPITVPILPVYVMIPTLSAVRLPDRTPLELLSVSISTDATQWGWSLSATLPLSVLALINPADAENPPEIEVSVNGYAWTFSVESFSDGRRFGARTASIRGRSRSAVLATPNAPRRTRTQADARDIAQLADEELDGTGWTLVWDALDYLVPGGTWSYAELAPIDALVRLAAGIGARVESDRKDLELAVKPRYPVSPWEWGDTTPYAILPASIVTVADGDWRGGDNANGVYVYAETPAYGGALVKIDGTAGEIQAPQVVERLVVDTDSARERGRQELAAASRIKVEQVTIPLFPSPADPGLIPIGALLQISEGDGWRGQCQGVRIDATRNGSALSVRQVLTIERHFR